VKPPFKLTGSVLYVIVALILFGLIGTLGLLSGNRMPWYYLLAQVQSFLLGILHLYFLYRFIPRLEVDRFLPGLGFTMLLMLLGGIAIALLHRFVFGTHLYGFATCVIPFLVPYLFAWVYRWYLAIPPPDHRKWYYPQGQPMPDMDLVDLSRILVIQFDLPKRLTDASHTKFKAKAPFQMPLGMLFLIFINDYNEQNTANGIQYLDENNSPVGWHFYRKGGWWSFRNYLDPELTFQQNNILDDYVIIAERVLDPDSIQN
jgi:hypothetical protein